MVKTIAQSGGVLPRSYRLGKLGVSLVGSYLGYQLQNFFLGETERPQRKSHFQKKASRQVRDELGALKGPAMKLGQLLSTQNGTLPEEAVLELLLLAGFYRTVSYLTNALRLPLEPYAARFPA